MTVEEAAVSVSPGVRAPVPLAPQGRMGWRGWWEGAGTFLLEAGGRLGAGGSTGVVGGIHGLPFAARAYRVSTQHICTQGTSGHVGC